MRQRDRLIGIGEPVLRSTSGSPSRSRSRAVPASRWPPLSALVIRCSTRPSTSILERNRDLLKRGTVLVDPDDPGEADP